MSACMGDPAKPAGVAVLEALGLPSSGCTSLVVRFEPDNAVKVEVSYLPSQDQVEAAAQILRGYMVALTPADG